MRLMTRDLQEAIAAVSDVYYPHDVKVLESNRGIDAVLEASGASRQQFVTLRYAAPVKIDAGTFDNLLLFMTCVDGAAEARQGRISVHWGKGRTLPLSPNISSQLTFDRQFCQKSIRLDKNLAEEVCSRLIGRALDVPLRFRLTPFSANLEAAWRQALHLIRAFEDPDLSLAPHAWKQFEEFLGILVVEAHPHNYSDVLRHLSSAADPRLVREAEHLMQTGGPAITVGEVAKALRVSLRSLELGFREARNMTPIQAHRRIRLNAAREALLNSTPSTSVTSVAMSCGFPHLARFSGYYQQTFGETPNQTLRRCRSGEA
ncbi:AraC family transcriptional regulator [Bradyrhizobium japonicum]|uniref:AraC family transcriptional regulator n=1 Tax=Bradyrhizobium japonicum TaxID=375 RepID=UPI001BACE4B0|nr:helix-turn-helix domain-containing protein [Bradyrhizobium japonicum]MBR0911565.1 helix-turn-helix domain-containing protein [Bradyrhizobium japonicum]